MGDKDWELKSRPKVIMTSNRSWENTQGSSDKKVL